MQFIIKTLIVIILLLGIAAYIFFTGRTSVTANTDSFVYELPFKPGDRYKVVQGYGGYFSHQHIAALDFNTPVGTPVYAARGGTVYSYRDDHDEGGPFSSYKSKANYIIIRHDDGSFGCYWHLQKDGVVVKTGKVVKGQQIGFSGATGYVLRPHLHFSVKRKLNYYKDSFVQTRFRTTKGILLLERGKSYERPTE